MFLDELHVCNNCKKWLRSRQQSWQCGMHITKNLTHLEQFPLVIHARTHESVHWQCETLYQAVHGNLRSCSEYNLHFEMDKLHSKSDLQNTEQWKKANNIHLLHFKDYATSISGFGALPWVSDVHIPLARSNFHLPNIHVTLHCKSNPIKWSTGSNCAIEVMFYSVYCNYWSANAVDY